MDCACKKLAWDGICRNFQKPTLTLKPMHYINCRIGNSDVEITGEIGIRLILLMFKIICEFNIH